ncbi:glycosyltransferase family 2 protein [Agrococcus jenensis]|uniref:GT2 family glycosyltransferase n=1 Tax=Agrococcus jenensis TaxID=46353 RepID=A0A3N2AWH2_9MICO|nr:glycosyltransferase family 2 protein [Agrococcus jenensis]ROR67379.1 GT2 family glycosyltransferase [Agrococcus jenensis]
MTDLPPFAVIVVNFASSALLRDHAASLDAVPPGRVIVVDCFSGAAERERVRQLASEHGWDTVLLDTNDGFGGGTNAGAARAIEQGAGVLVALNPDATIERDSLARLVSAVAEDPMLLASPRIVQSSGEPWFVGADLYLDEGIPRGARARARFAGAERLEWATGACFAISAELWTLLGGFDEEYFLYWEDIDLSHRAIAAGARLELVDAEVVHDQGGTHAERRSARAKSELYYYFNIRNRMLYAVKHLPDVDVRRWARSSARIGYGVLLRGGRQQLVASWRPWRGYLRGLRDGRRIVRAHRRSTARLHEHAGRR